MSQDDNNAIGRQMRNFSSYLTKAAGIALAIFIVMIVLPVSYFIFAYYQGLSEREKHKEPVRRILLTTEPNTLLNAGYAIIKDYEASCRHIKDYLLEKDCLQRRTVHLPAEIDALNPALAYGPQWGYGHPCM
jgi:hypothetical protein